MASQLSMPVKGDKIAIMTTNRGVIKFKLFEKECPKTVENFTTHAQNGYYEGIIFHRVIKDFMIQGGDPTGTGMGGSEENIRGECAENGWEHNDIPHERGVISMARAKDPDSASSQFFICHADAKFLDGQYAGFGKVVEGIETVDKIASVATNYNDKPLTPQVMKKVYFVERA
mgnify:CR=1 FL=1